MYHIYKNKRRNPDLILTLLAWTNAIAGISLVVVLILFAFAKPDLETFFDRYYDITLRSTWNHAFSGYIAFFLCLSLVSSATGLYLNGKRLRRKDDYIRAMLVVSLVISTIGLILILRLMLRA
jgi:hypothetical protein